MSTINLSWIITTRNKLTFLKEVLHPLLSNLHEDEEIIVVDGASTDGTVAYLTELHRQGLIHHFLSEPDHGEAEGFNKGMLMANGQLIKILTDDDAFYLPGIRCCKEYMLSSPQLDFIGTDGAAFNWGPSNNFDTYSHTHSIDYQEWVKTSKPFDSCGLGIMLRKESLPLLGLFHTGVMRVDAEYTLRVTSGKAKIAWYTGRTWIHIPNLQSNVVVHGPQIDFEGEKLYQFYTGNSIRPLSDLQILDLAKTGIGTNRFDDKSVVQGSSHGMQNLTKENISSIFRMCDAWLTSYIQNEEGYFLTR